MLFLVTVKVKPRPGHDPLNKVESECPVNGVVCSDATGAHHTVLIEAQDRSFIERKLRGSIHVTRIEAADPMTCVQFKNEMGLV